MKMRELCYNWANKLSVVNLDCWIHNICHAEYRYFIDQKRRAIRQYAHCLEYKLWMSNTKMPIDENQIDCHVCLSFHIFGSCTQSILPLLNTNTASFDTGRVYYGMNMIENNSTQQVPVPRSEDMRGNFMFMMRNIIRTYRIACPLRSLASLS